MAGMRGWYPSAIWPIAFVLSLIVYAGTRGESGKPGLLLLGLPLFALCYWFLMAVSVRLPGITLFLHFIFLEGAAIIALAIKPELDEMAGMLNLFVPVAVAPIAPIGLLINWLRSARRS